MFDNDVQVYVIDDDASVRAALEKLLTLVGLKAKVFASIPEFLAAERSSNSSCLILDVRLPGMSGLEFQDELARKGVRIPIIFITAHGDVPMTRRAMKAGAVDFLTKPFRKNEIVEAIHQALERDRLRRAEEGEVLTLRQRYETLTPREREVLELVSQGLLNKQIAAELALSEASVKFHRAHVMEKMEAPSVADLVRMTEKLKPRPRS